MLAPPLLSFAPSISWHVHSEFVVVIQAGLDLTISDFVEDCINVCSFAFFVFDEFFEALGVLVAWVCCLDVLHHYAVAREFELDCFHDWS